MATIAEQLTSLANTKTAIKDAIVAKGVAVADTDPFSAYAGKIGQISGCGGGSTEWQPNPLWPDIEKLVEEDTSAYLTKIGVVCYGIDDVSVFSNTTIGQYSKILTSDGAEYDVSKPYSYTITHTWDKTKDIDDGTGFPVRYLICMTGSVAGYDGTGLFNGFLAGDSLTPAYIYIKGSYSKTTSSPFSNNPLLQYVKINGEVGIGSFGAFDACTSLVQIPKNLVVTFRDSGAMGVPFSRCPRITDFSSLVLPENFPGTSMSYFKWPGVLVMPDNVLSTKPTSLSYAGSAEGSFASLIKIPDGWDLSQCTDFKDAFYNGAPNLVSAGTVDMSANTVSFASYNSPFNTSKLREIKCTLPSNTNVWFDKSKTISIESFRFMADHAPDVTATPRTLTVGSTNISRINAADPTIITDLNARGWTVA